MKNRKIILTVGCALALMLAPATVYADTAESRHAVTISTGQELIEKINENPNGFYVLEKDISMADINLTGEVYRKTAGERS